MGCPRNYYLTYYDMETDLQIHTSAMTAIIQRFGRIMNVSSAPKVYQTFKKRSNVTHRSFSRFRQFFLCVVCHNLPELKVPYTENDTYLTPVYPTHHITPRTGQELSELEFKHNSQLHLLPPEFKHCVLRCYDRPLLNNQEHHQPQHSYNSSNPTCYVSQCTKQAGYTYHACKNLPQTHILP